MGYNVSYLTVVGYSAVRDQLRCGCDACPMHTIDNYCIQHNMEGLYYKTKPDVLTCSHYGVVYMALGSITMTTNVCTELPELLERVIINAHDGLDV